MNSVSEACSQLKQNYDACFNTWFTEKFLRGDHSTDSCGPFFKVYRECVRKAIQEQNIDLKEIEKEVMGTENEFKTPDGSK
ncbi:hypothetical protein DAPPUDRAFT_301169 [Daphnia pulex]|uniref:TP53 regulated inhibitor of apoptosis 1 n=1 Tax=Daphnia pulex TaxID=6669 RepID=E9HGQ9_DAPPU|nr:hypothetical protein DAPPUDRAFT_301169 [Daphnia pulex]|eukprot:EFX69007.1 hypothetical protein DAPPUDRAFT_301169 [Daphnia pulex]